MLRGKKLRRFTFVLSVFYLAVPWILSGQTSPDIIWKRQVNVDRVNSVIFTPNGETLISGGSDRLINLWRVSDGTLLQTLNTNAAFVHESSIESLSITPDGSLLASCSYRLIQLWSLPSGNVRRLTGHIDWVVGVAFSPNGNILASASFDTTTKIWRASDGALLQTIPGTAQQRCVAFSPDGTLLAVAGGDNNIRVFRTSDWTLVRTLIGHAQDVYAIAFSPDGNNIASGGYDKTVKLWSVATGALRFTFSGNGGNVYGVAFTPDSSKLAYTDGEGNTIKIYRTTDGALARTFTQEVNAVQTLAFSKDGLLGYGRIDTMVVLARIATTPVARITSPVGGTTFYSPADITISASPSKSDGSITKMEFFQNGLKLGEDITAPFSFDWPAVAPGSYTLTVVDTDDLGATTRSSPVTITVIDPTAPSVSITSPNSGTTFNTPASVTITASAAATAGVVSVQFFQNGISLGQDTNAPFLIEWSSVPTGNYSLTAIVTDTNGITATSAAINIYVGIAPPETTKPQVTIQSPGAGATLTSPSITIKGTSSDNVAVAQVLYSLNSSAFLAAYGTENWEANVTLLSGENVVQVKSVDTSGNESVIVSRSFTYVNSSALSLQIVGNGRVTPLQDGQILEVGKTYSVKAVPGADYVFNGWTGSVTNSNATLSFVMSAGINLTANFVPNPFAVTKGTYYGLIQSVSPSHQRTGFLRIVTTRTGSFSGKVSIGGQTYSVRGKFNGDGSFSATHPELDINLRLQLHLTDNSDQITGAFYSSSFTSSLVGNRTIYHSKTNPAPTAGKYTVVIPPDASRASSPQGSSFAVLKVDASGAIRVAGSLADGTPFTQSAAISKTSTWPFYVLAYAKGGSISGVVTFRDQTGVSDLDGIVNWFRPSQPGATFFENGFVTQTTLIGSGYGASPGSPVLEVSDGEENVVINLGDGDLTTELQQPARLGTANKLVVPPSSENLRASISTSSGALKGSFIHPVTGRTTKHRGVIFQKQNLAEGYFLGAEQSGFVSVVPIDQAASKAVETAVLEPLPIETTTTTNSLTSTVGTTPKKRKRH